MNTSKSTHNNSFVLWIRSNLFPQIINLIGFTTLLLTVMSLTHCRNIKSEADAEKEHFIDSLLALMTIEEKAGQMTLYSTGWTETGPVLNENYLEDVRTGWCGNLYNAHTVAYNTKLQKIAVEETRLGIPLLFAYDVIHGHRTTFPIPLAEACTWDLECIEKTTRFSAMEAAASGLTWTFGPMVDIARDPRWGRIAEGSGEDAYLGSLISAAKVKGFQGENLNDPLTIAACVKHYAAYGAAQAGRDYHTVDMSERTLREVYLPPYKAAVDAGVATVMTSFNELNGIPATANKFLMKDILRDEWGFDGFIITDYTAINELVPHGFARDVKHASELALNVGVDMDLQGSVFRDFLIESVTEGKISEEKIDIAVRRILEVKYDLGLFGDPYLYLDEDREKEILFSEEIMDHALESAKKSIVLLKNEPFKGEKLLPLDKSSKTIALIGPLADNQIDMLGAWHASGEVSKVVTVQQGLKNYIPNAKLNYLKGCEITGDNKSQFSKAINLARNSDLVILVLGENHIQSGEAASRSDISLPGVQQDLMKEIVKTGKPVVVIIMAGRPLTIPWMAENVPAIINAWHLGTRAGDAVAEVLTGKYNPSGKLTVSFPWSVGQIPVFYNVKNTGRPKTENRFTSKYLDVSNDPLFPFGFGLSYTEFSYSNLILDKSTIQFNDSLQVSVEVENTGTYSGEETVQLYIQDLVGSVTRPVKELKGFEKITLQPGEKGKVSFTIHSDLLRFYDAEMNYTAEPGTFRVYVGTNSVDVIEGEFELIE